jgi:hypothetical protein
MASPKTMDDLVARHGVTTSQKEKALIERELADSLREGSSKEFRYEELRHLIPGSSSYDLANRNYLLRHAPESVWALVDDGMSLRQARKTLADARRMSKVKGTDIAACFEQVHKSVLNESIPASGKNGTFYKRRSGTRKSIDWVTIEGMVKTVLTEELQEEGFDADSLSSDFLTDLKVLVKQYKVRTTARKESLADRRASSESEDKLRRREVLPWFRELGLDPPKPGRRADMREVRRTYRRLAGDNHPDKHPDMPHVADKFRRVNEAYKFIEAYDEYMKGKE